MRVYFIKQREVTFKGSNFQKKVGERMDEIKMRVTGIEKSFPGVRALRGIDFAVRKGTVHALCGENGAGKSTLMKIIMGLYRADKGEIFLDGRAVDIRNPVSAGRLGISMIAQELNYVPELSVEENLFLGRLPVNKLGKVDWKKVRREAKRLLIEEALPYSPEQKLKTLTISDIQMLEIIKAMSNHAQVIIMDEPTSSITQKETEQLFAKIRELKGQGVSIIYISHKMEEVFKIADDITILRDGAVVSSDRAGELNLDTVISRMVGRRLDSVYPKETVEMGEKVLEVEHFTRKGLFQDISFYARRGEIIGFAGLVGAGRTETMRAVFGLDPHDSGQIRLQGMEIQAKSPRESISHKLVMLSESRREDGIVPIRSVAENASLASLGKFIYKGRAHRAKERSAVGESFARMQVKTPSLDTPISSLSGGNQQKVLLSRWMLCEPEVMILDEPTRGIDVGAKFEIYKLITQIVKEQKAVVMVSSELPELIGMCDRIYVMCQGRISGCIGREAFSQETIMKYAAGLAQENPTKAQDNM